MVKNTNFQFYINEERNNFGVGLNVYHLKLKSLLYALNKALHEGMQMSESQIWRNIGIE